MDRAAKLLNHLQPVSSTSGVESTPCGAKVKEDGPYAYRDGLDFMPENPSKTKVIQTVLKLGIFPDIPAVELFDLTSFENFCKGVQAAPFPPGTIHAMACKAQPTAKVLATACKHGIGCETASLPELMHATRCGFSPKKLIFDSPSKTPIDIKFALQTGVWLNADNFMELGVINDIIKGMTLKPWQACGIRINVQTSKKVGASITSNPTSKFGVGMLDDRQGIIDQYIKYPWLNAIHVHCGSQGVAIDFLVDGAKDILKLVEDISAARPGNPIKNIDIGGGLETDYLSQDGESSLAKFYEYASKLKARVPGLYSGKYQIATEFGRALSAKNAFALSRVEYTKMSGGRHIATTHIGADYDVRGAYSPALWMPKLSVYDGQGAFKDGSKGKEVTDIAGPLCFSGDLVVRNLNLPSVKRGDYIVCHDTGAYHMGMWSRYNSRQAPPCIGYKPTSKPDSEGTIEGLLTGVAPMIRGGFEFTLLKKGESVEDVLRFWQ